MTDFLSQNAPDEGRSILFIDIDGTLIDSFPGIRAGFLHALDTLGVDHPGIDFIQGIAGPPMEQTFAALGLDDEQIREGFEAYMSYTHDGGWKNCAAFNGIPLFLQWAKDEGFWLATASSKGEGFARLSLEHLGLLQYFDFLGAAQEYGPRRAKKAVLKYVLDSNALTGRESDVLMIGDRTHDIEGARAFGITSVAVEWGYGTAQEWATADYQVATLNQLKETIHDWSTDSSA